MPTKPKQNVIDASKKTLDPREVLTAIINDSPELNQALIAKGLVSPKED